MAADGSNIIALIPTSRERAALAHIALAPVVPLVEARPRVDVSTNLNGCTVWLLGKPYVTGLTLSNASRVASALMTLDALDCLQGSGPPPLTPDAA